MVIRSRIDIDPHTGGMAITSDRLPQIVLGVPLGCDRSRSNIDRPGFIVNPTSCNAEQITATIAGTEGATTGATNPFAVGGCKDCVQTHPQSLHHRPNQLCTRCKFRPEARAPDGGGRRGEPQADESGAAPPAPPRGSPPLQGSCRGSTFDSNPAACPTTSIVGIAKARSPVLSADLVGPVYLISRGPNVFPSPVVVLQGEGITLDLSGATTSEQGWVERDVQRHPRHSRAQHGDVPFPQGPHSLLSANTKLCARREAHLHRHSHRDPQGRWARPDSQGESA